MNPLHPKLKTQLKIHKHHIPIHPVTNNINSLAYEVAQFL
jgi:hypothetical protein